MDQRIPIQPYNLVRQQLVKSVDLRVVNLQLFSSVTVAVCLYNEDGYVCDNRSVEISGAEYLAWNNDDSYLVNLVMTKLGLALPTPVEAPVEAPADAPTA